MNTTLPQQVTILLEFAQGRTERLPLDPGVWKIGSSSWGCDVVLAEPGIEPFHGLLEIREGVVTFEDHSTPLFAEEGEQRAQVVLEPGEALTIGSVRLTIGSHYVWPTAQRLDSPGGTAQVRANSAAGLSLGTIGYPRFQRILADEISPDEAAEAEKRFSSILWSFAYLLGGWLLLVSVRWFLPAMGEVAQIHADWCVEAATLITLVAVSFFGIPFAGQILLPLAVLFWIASVPEEDWANVGYTAIGKMISLLPMNWLIGLALDWGASTERGRSWVEARRWILVLLGSFYVMGFLANRQASDPNETPLYSTFQWVSLAMSLVVGLWGWIAVPRIEAEREAIALDVQTVLDGAVVRWGRLALGQLLAVVAGLMPLVMFLSALGMTERLAWPEDQPDAVSNPVVISKRSSGEPVAWFWTTRGHYLREADLQLPDAKIYAFHDSDFDGKTLEAIEAALTFLKDRQSGVEAAAAYRQLEGWLTPHRTKSAKQLAAFLSEQNGWIEVVKYQPGRVLHLETQSTTALGFDGKPRTIYHADRLALEKIQQDNRALSFAGTIANYFYLAFAIIGFTMLWRRGGESPVARWLGLLLIGFSSFLLIGASNWLVRSMEYELWLESLHSGSVASLKIAALAWINAVTMLVNVAVVLAIPFSVVWVELCWPSTRPEEERGLIDWILSMVKISGVTFGFYFFAFILSVGFIFIQSTLRQIALGPDAQPPEPAPALISAVVVAIFAAVLLGAWLRTTASQHSEVPHFGWKPLTMMGSGFSGVILLIFWQHWEMPEPWQADLCLICGLVLVGIFVGTALGSMLADNFLRLSEARDLSAILATAVLPFALEASAFLIDFLFRDFHLLLHSEHGSMVLSILLAVLVMIPLHSWLEHNFKRWSVAPLSRLAGDVANELDEFPALSEPERQARIDAFFERWQIPSYAFYARAEGNVFLPVVGHHEGQLPPLPLSANLLEFLQERPHFCDLEHIPFEWSYYFQQFELYRLQQASGARYLLPLVLGPTVRGLLLLHECPGAEILARDAIAEELAPLGLEVVCRGIVLRNGAASPGLA